MKNCGVCGSVRSYGFFKVDFGYKIIDVVFYCECCWRDLNSTEAGRDRLAGQGIVSVRDLPALVVKRFSVVVPDGHYVESFDSLDEARRSASWFAGKYEGSVGVVEMVGRARFDGGVSWVDGAGVVESGESGLPGVGKQQSKPSKSGKPRGGNR